MNSRSVAYGMLVVAMLLSLPGCGPSPSSDFSKGNQVEAVESAAQPERVIDFSIGEGWHTFRGDKNSTGVATGILPEQLDELWQFQVKNSAFETTPVIVRGKEKEDAGRVYIGDADKFFYALDLATGKVQWQFETEFGFTAPAAYSDGRIYVGDIDGKFYCLSQEGEKLWEFVANAQIDSGANFFGNFVLFGSRDAKLYALNRTTGEKVWELETADEVRCGITISNGHAFVAGCDAAFHIIDVESGREIGNVPIDSPSGATPASQENFAFTGTENAGFFAIDWKQAKVVWNFNDEEGAISTRSSAAVSDPHVVFGTSHRTVYSLNPATGRQNWATELKSSIETSPIIVGQHAFVGSNDGRLYKLNLADGEILWSRQFNGGFIGSPAVAFGKLVIATDRGVVYCLGSP